MKMIDLRYANSIYKRVIIQTVRLIKTVRLNIWKAIVRAYGTFNRVIKENFRTVLLIETVLIIESLEYLSTKGDRANFLFTLLLIRP